ncbi:Fc receptor-like protein 5 [Centroberyx gerrardi]
MGRTSLCVLVLFLLSTLLYHGHAQGRTDAVLTLEPNRSHVFTGESVTFICDMREGQDTDWWYKINRNGQEFLRYSPSKRYTFQPPATGYSGEYQCIGDLKRYTNHIKETNKVNLTVSDGDVILESPAFALFVGESVTLRCRHRIQGNENRASFYRDGSLVEIDTNHPSIKIPETTEEMTINPVSKTDEGSYKCKFGEQDGAESKERELKVEAVKPKATLSAYPTIPVGGRVTLTCSVEESSGWKYYWYRQTTDSGLLIMEDGVPNLNRDISVSDGGLYWCRGGRGEPIFFTQDSDAKTINKIVSNRAVVTLQPNWPQIYSGETITLRCEIQGGGDTEWEYEWRTTNSYKPLKQAAYRIVRASVSDSGDYSCKGRQRSDLYSSTEWSNTITLTVSSRRPKAKLSADKTAIPVGGSVTLTCSVQESSGWKYYWYRKEKDSEPLTTEDDDPNSNKISVSQEGLYWCRGVRGDSVYYTEYSDSIRIDKNVANRAVVTLQPNWPQIYSGETITLRCEIQGGGDTDWEYEWRTSNSYKPQKQNEYRISSAYSYHSGDYSCKGRQRNGQQSSTEWSSAFKLTVSYKPTPVLTVSPVWLSPGASVNLSCEVEGSSAGWRFYWYKAVPKLSDNSYTYELLPGSNDGTAEGSYILHGPTHTGGYMCTAGRGDPVFYSHNSKPKFIWSGDRRSSASVTVSPNRTQHFSSESVSLSCEGNSTEWTVKRFTEEGYLEHCSPNWGSMTGSKCNIDSMWTSAVYWCESGSGEFSNAVNITGQYGSLILLSPVHPVTEGDSVTLGCKSRTEPLLSNVDFYRNDKLIQNETTGEMTIHAVSKSDEGFYKCKYSGTESPQSWMAVKYKPTPVLTVSPVWLSPGASVTLSCEVEGSSAGWRFYWYKAVPKLSDNSYTYELLPGSNDGTAEGSYILHGPTHTGGYMCTAGRGDPVFYSRDSEPKFIWSGDRRSSASVTVSPNRTQHFSSESVSLSCEGNSTEWRVKRFTEEGYLEHCTSYWGSMTGSKCNIIDIRSSAVYWCESGSGEFSNAVNITVQYGSLILLSPVHPVTEGDSVTLGCKSRTEPLRYNVDFYRNDKLIQNETTGEMTIHAVSKSDEGFYKCKYSEYSLNRGTESPQSWMAVKFAVSRPASSSFPVWLIIGLVTVILLIILLLLLCCYRKSKDPCCGRPIQSQSTNQGSTTDQREDQENGRTPLHGDAYVYESIKGSEDTENGGPADESNDITYSSIELKNVHKKVKHVDPAESSVYSDVKIGSTTEESNVTYAQVYHQNKGKAKDNKGK